MNTGRIVQVVGPVIDVEFPPKSMPAILNEGAYDAWLGARAAQAKEFLRAYPAQKLLANPVEKKGRKDPLGMNARAPR